MKKRLMIYCCHVLLTFLLVAMACSLSVRTVKATENNTISTETELSTETVVEDPGLTTPQEVTELETQTETEQLTDNKVVDIQDSEVPLAAGTEGSDNFIKVILIVIMFMVILGLIAYGIIVYHKQRDKEFE